tara:strand:- start:5253 stop:6092 length:840 start_codon:yes stop_codon:yes gene_type:complete
LSSVINLSLHEEPVNTKTPTTAEFSCRVDQNLKLNAEYFHLYLDAPEVALKALPGQFFHLMCPSSELGDPFFRRPMSIYKVDKVQRKIQFLFKNAGVGTNGLSKLNPEEFLNIVGPLGVGFTIPNGTRHIIVVGRGVGLATLAPLAEMASQKGVQVTAILSARRLDLLMSSERFRSTGAEVIQVHDEDNSSAVENIEILLRQLNGDAFYTCGSNRLFKLIKRLSKELNIFGQVALEQQMACGIGVCFCCVRTFEINGKNIHKRVCSEGPVFDVCEATGW